MFTCETTPTRTAKRSLEVLAEAGFAVKFDGLDYSQGMLEVAQEKGNYEQLVQGDLTKALAFRDSEYCGVVSSGTFLQGHVGAEAIPELTRILRPGGCMVFSVRPTFWEDTRTEWMAALEKGGMEAIEVEMMPYAEDMLAPIVSCTKRQE